MAAARAPRGWPAGRPAGALGTAPRRGGPRTRTAAPARGRRPRTRPRCTVVQRSPPRAPGRLHLRRIRPRALDRVQSPESTLTTGLYASARPGCRGSCRYGVLADRYSIWCAMHGQPLLLSGGVVVPQRVIVGVIDCRVIYWRVYGSKTLSAPGSSHEPLIQYTCEDAGLGASTTQAELFLCGSCWHWPGYAK